MKEITKFFCWQYTAQGIISTEIITYRVKYPFK